jgi:cyclic pyranopterin phosphate synthase
MVDVGEKSNQHRKAIAEGFISLSPATINLIKENLIKKGDVLSMAECAGIMGGKKCSELIPLCHPILITKLRVRADLTENGAKVKSEVHCVGQTGVEMEALTAVSVALLTIYDMCKAVDKNMVMSEVKLISKEKK